MAIEQDINSFARGFQAIQSAGIYVAPAFVGTMAISAVLSWLLGPREFGKDEQKTVLPFYKVHQFWRVFSYVLTFSIFGMVQGFIIGSASPGQNQIVSTIVSSFLAVAASYLAFFHTKDFPEEVRRTLAPAIIGLFASILLFMFYPAYYTTAE